jgi:hypothetical protein
VLRILIGREKKCDTTFAVRRSRQTGMNSCIAVCLQLNFLGAFNAKNRWLSTAAKATKAAASAQITAAPLPQRTAHAVRAAEAR